MATAEAEYETLDAYHRDTSRMTSTALRTLIIDGPVVYCETFVTCRMPPAKPKKEFLLGTASHTLLLEPERFEATVKVIPADKLALKGGKVDADGARSGNKYKDFCAEHPGCVLLKAAEYDQVRWMADEVFREAREVIEAAGAIETTVYWTDPQTGIPCKCRPDKLCERAALVDIKTCADITNDGFAKACGNFRYDCQLAHYVDGIEQEHGYRPECLIVAIEKTPPFRVKVIGFHPDGGPEGFDLDVGWRDNHDALAEIKQRTESGDWREHKAGEVIQITIPPYARKRR